MLYLTDFTLHMNVGLCFPMEQFMLLCCQVACSALKVLKHSALCSVLQKMLFELDLILSKPGFAPALLQASCVAFGNVFTHPMPQFSPLKKIGIMFLSLKRLGG